MKSTSYSCSCHSRLFKLFKLLTANQLQNKWASQCCLMTRCIYSQYFVYSLSHLVDPSHHDVSSNSRCLDDHRVLCVHSSKFLFTFSPWELQGASVPQPPEPKKCDSKKISFGVGVVVAWSQVTGPIFLKLYTKSVF